MPEPTVVQSIADDRIVAASNKHATAQTTTSVAQTEIAIAQSQIAASAAKLANLDDIPFADYSVWLTIASARSKHPNAATASLPEVALYADKMLVEFKQRFPRPAIANASDVIKSKADSGYLPDLNVSLFQPVTEKPPAP